MIEIRAPLPRVARSPKIRFRSMYHDIVVPIDWTCVLSILRELLTFGHEVGPASGRRIIGLLACFIRPAGLGIQSISIIAISRNRFGGDALP